MKLESTNLLEDLRHVARHVVLGFVVLLRDRTVIVISVLFGIVIFSLMWQQSRQRERLVKSNALLHAARYSDAIAEFRSLYTSEVVAAVKDRGIQIIHDYAGKEGAIPLPATLSMLLGNRLAEKEGGGHTRLYSPYPFPWRRETGGLKDEFARQAWAALTQDPDKPFYKIENEKGQQTLRYAIADRMRASCIDCHNSHPQTPKNDWREGDLRGILEISFSMEQATARTESSLQDSWWLIAGISVLGFSCVSIVVCKQREGTRRLEQHVVDRTQELQSATKKQTEMLRLLKEREARLHGILETASEGIVTIDARGVVESFNKAATEMFGYRAEEVVGRNVAMLMPTVHREQHDQYWANYSRTGQAEVLGVKREVEGSRIDGTLFPLELNVSEVNTGSGKRFTAILRDLTEHKRSGAALRESHEYVKNIIDSMANSLIVVTPDGTIVTVNEATCGLLGYREEELIGQPASLLFLEDEKEEEREDPTQRVVPRKILSMKGAMLRTLISVGHVNDVEGWYAAKDGRKIPMSFSGSVMWDGNGEIQGIVCVAQDSTERKQLQCELAQAQKLEAVGQLAAGIAHEINTPIQYVGDNTRFLKEAFGDINTVLNTFEKLLQEAKDSTIDGQLVAEVEATLQQADVEYLTEEIPQAIDQSLDGVDRVAKIVRAMKEFSHPGTEEKSPVNLTEAIETTITVARNEWKYVAEIVTEFDPDLPAVSCLPGELNQVVLNLIVNAAHAIGDMLGDDCTKKGTITVGTRRDGEWAEIFVRDTGSGIPEDVRARIFDPFFTTKGVGKGTGQGLAIARSVVVDKHGGTIDCETEQGKGTTFVVRLPLDGQRQTQEVTEYDDACSIR